MRGNITFTIIILFFAQINAQNNKIPNLKTCEGNENALACSYFTIHNLLQEKLNSLDISNFDKIDNEIIISSSLRFDENGMIDALNSIFYSKNLNIEKELNDVLNQIPSMILKVNNKGEQIASYYRNTFYFNYSENSFSQWNKQDSEESDFFIPEKVPVFSGCKSKWDNQKLMKCLNQKVSRYIVTSFNSKEVLKNSNILPGTSVKILTSFKIDSTGKIIDIKANANHKALEDEAIRVLNKISKIEPGYLSEKPITVPIRLPIIFSLTF